MAQNQYNIFDPQIGLDPWMKLSSSDPQLMPSDESILPNAIANNITMSDIGDAEQKPLITVGKKTFSDTTNGKIEGIDPSNGTYKWLIGSGTSSVDWNVTTADTLTINGSLSATTGTIGGWTISSNSLSSGNVSLNSTAETILLGSATAPMTGTGIFLGKDGSDYEFRAGNPSGDYIHWNGTNLLLNGEQVATIALRANTIYEQFIFIGSSDDGLSTTVDAFASIGRGFAVSRIRSEQAANDSILYSLNFDSNANTIDWDKDLTMICIASTSADTSQDVFLGMGDTPFNTSVPENHISTFRHVAFMIQDGTLYASNANGTTQTSTDISSGITVTTNHNFRIEFVSGTNVKFYVDDVLEATHTTNLPAANSNTVSLSFGIRAQEAATKDLRLRNDYKVIIEI